jgi:GNAT superfamily N-acetyltransferase
VSGFRIEKLARHHGVDTFDCGVASLNRFLNRFALTNQLANASQTYVALADAAVIGFHTLVVGEVAHMAAPDRMKKGLPSHPVPIMVLARLAVHRGWQGRGIGAGLLKDAVLRTLAAADIAGIRALMAHAKDESARAFYGHFDFVPGFSDPLHLFVLIKDLRALTDTSPR